jgi:hypothetical protein
MTATALFPIEQFERILHLVARRRALVFVLPLLVVDSEQGVGPDRQAPGRREARMRFGGSYRTVRTVLGTGVLINGGHGWKFWLPGKPKRGSSDHVICPLEERDDCGPHWVRGYEERNPPRCRQHSAVMRRCKGCRHRRD